MCEGHCELYDMLGHKPRKSDLELVQDVKKAIIALRSDIEKDLSWGDERHKIEVHKQQQRALLIELPVIQWELELITKQGNAAVALAIKQAEEIPERERDLREYEREKARKELEENRADEDRIRREENERRLYYAERSRNIIRVNWPGT